MSKIIVPARSKNIVTGEVEVVDREVALKDIKDLRMGHPSTVGGKYPQGVRVTLIVLHDGSDVVVYALAQDIFTSICKAGSSHKPAKVKSCLPVVVKPAETTESFVTPDDAIASLMGDATADVDELDPTD